MPKLFFSYLKPYKFDRANKLVRLNNRLIISIKTVFDDPKILKLPDLTKLYSPGKQNPELKYLFWRHANNTLGRVRYDKMRKFGGKGRQR